MSIRIKFLMALIGLPLSVLSILLFFAVRTIEKDKIAYVYETASSITGSISQQIENHLKEVKNQIRFYATLEDPNANPSMREHFATQTSISALFRYRSTNPEPLQTIFEKAIDPGSSLKTSTKLKSILSDIPESESITFDAEAKGFWVSFKSLDSIWIAFSNQESILKNISKPGPYTLALAGAEGKTLFATDEASHDLLEQISAYVSKATKEGQTNLTQLIKVDKDKELLLTTQKIPSFPYLVYSFIPKKDAISVIYDLLQEALYVFMILSALSVLVGLFTTQELTSSLTNLIQATRRITEGHFEIRLPIRSTDEVGTLSKSFNLMALEIQRLLKETAEKSRMETELKTAQMVQSTFFPKDFSEYSGIKVCGRYTPASECSGDWWFHFEHQNKTYCYIGDATGHGVSAALLTGVVYTLIESIRNNPPSPGQILALLNSQVHQAFKGQIMMTFLATEYSPTDGKLVYANASHEPSFVFRKQSEDYTRQSLALLNAVNSPRIGSDPNAEFPEAEITLGPGDRIFAYTDGVQDLQDAKGVALGERKMIKILLDSLNSRTDLNNTVSGFDKSLMGYKEKMLIDDVTYLMIEVG